MSIAKSTYHKVLRRDKFKCCKCYTNQNLTIHHIQHREHGGTDDPENLITMCFSCHRVWHRTYDRNNKAKFYKYISPVNEFDMLVAIREANDKQNESRNYTVCNAGNILPYSKKGKRKIKIKGRRIKVWR